MRFCPKCGSLMVPEKKDGKVIWVCRKCGYTENSSEKSVTVKRSVEETRGIPVVDMEKEKKELPVVDVVCPKCGKRGALFWTRQTRAGDEPETRFFKCIHCGYTWREYA